MISYQMFLHILVQIFQKNRAHLTIEDREFLIYKQEGRWFLSTLLFNLDQAPYDLKSFSFFRWQEKGAFIKQEAQFENFHLVQEITFSKYLPFKALFTNFLTTLEEWQEV